MDSASTLAPRRPAWLLIAIAGTLAACGGGASPGGAAANAPLAPGGVAKDAGAQLYESHCVPCHQGDGQGIAKLYPSLAGSPVVLGDPAALACWVLKGQRAASMPSGRYATAMPQFGWMKEADAAALLSYLRTHFGNAAPPVAAPEIAAALAERP